LRPSALLQSLERATRNHPLDRKILVAPAKQQGRELLRALSLSGTPWLGWEVATPWLLALELVHQDAGARVEVIADEFRIMRLVDESIDAVVNAGHPDLRQAASGVSFRAALQRAVALLRSTGRSPAKNGQSGRILAATLDVLAEYERRLSTENALDHAEILRRAVARVKSGTRPWSDARIYLAPTTHFGLRGELLQALLSADLAELLESERIHGLEQPEGLLRSPARAATSTLAFLHAPHSVPSASPSPSNVSVFAAATPMDELREVLRRVVGQNLPFDQVEIIATDARTYGNGLYALARRLGIPITMTNGIDLARTRTGRALRGYLSWLRDAFPAEALRIMLEAGDVATSDVAGVQLGQRLRQLRIGWGKQRYYAALTRALAAPASRSAPNDDQDAQEVEARRAQERGELSALHKLLVPILDAAPDGPPRLQATGTLYAPSTIARGLLVFLEHVAAGDENDGTVRALVRNRLERAVSELTRKVPWDTAIAIVRRAADLRVNADEEGAAAWTTSPGRLHFSDLRSGGLCGRAYTFVLGLDASRVAANAGVDPILTDRARRDVLGLPTSRERAAQRRFELAELLAGLRGSVTLSFSAWDATEGRAVPPAMELLQALRLARGDPNLNYTDLHRELGTLAGAVPQGRGRLDTGDVWLAALSSAAGVLHSATHLVGAAYPHLARGQFARRARDAEEFNAYHGKLSRAASAERVFSATQLETLGTCPRRYFYRHLLGVEAPERIDFDPERWLDPLERGSLLHRTYELALRRARERCVEYKEREFWNIAAATLRESIAITRDRLPPPGEEVYQREVRDLAEDLRHFVRMIRRLQPSWLELEFRFGESTPFAVETALGSLRLRGAIDRIDELEDGRLQVIDYKTGRKYGYWPARPFHGGRRIQHVVYSLAASRLLDREVANMEYHFPTLRGESEIVAYWPKQLGQGEEALARLQRIAAGDTFPTTDDPRDCRFCDFASVCRVAIDEYGRADSPPAIWSREIGLALPEGTALRFLRRVDG
jgi:RecB family exonuclease